MKGGDLLNRTTAVLVTAALLLLPANGLIAEDASAKQDLELVNQQLKGKVASIELADGSTVEKAKKVVVEPNFTYWMRKGVEHEVATDQVLRIQARAKSRTGLAMGLGAATFTLIVLGQNAPAGGDAYGSGAEAAGAIVLGGVGALIGWGINKAIPRKWHVVYDAQGSPVATPGEEQSVTRGD
jgi:hypothetical protein